MPSFVYSPNYDIRLGGLERLHPFDSRKFSRAWRRFVAACPDADNRCIPPRAVTREQLLTIHADSYLDRVLRKPSCIAQGLEIPHARFVPYWILDRRVLQPMRLATGGTIQAAMQAVECGCCINLSGGYHHACPDTASGFCFYADIPIAIKYLQRSCAFKSFVVIDLDAHQGNGIERSVGQLDNVHVFDMYNGDVYPQDRVARQQIRWDHCLPSGVSDKEYLELLFSALPAALDECPANTFAFYNAGTDILDGDPLGKMAVSFSGVLQRERFVFEQLTSRNIPWVMTTSGGYTSDSHKLIADSLSHLWKQHA